MNLEKLFRMLCGIGFLIMLSYFYDFNYLISSEYELDEIIDQSSNFWGLVIEENIIFFLFLIFLSLAIYPLLAFYVKFSRELLISLMLIYLVFEIFGGFVGDYTIESSIHTALGSIGSYIDGAILVLAYFTSLKDKWQ